MKKINSLISASLLFAIVFFTILFCYGVAYEDYGFIWYSFFANLFLAYLCWCFVPKYYSVIARIKTQIEQARTELERIEREIPPGHYNTWREQKRYIEALEGILSWIQGDED